MSTFFQDQRPPEIKDITSEIAEVSDPNSFGGNDPSPVPAASIPEVVVVPKFTKPDGANVVLSAERLNDALPEGLTNIGNTPVVLPSPGQQAVGFYLDPDTVSILRNQFGQYKSLVAKGQAAPPVTTGD